MAEALTSPVLEAVPHGFMTRTGGVSTGAVAGLQCGFGADDDAAAVEENRRIAAETVLPGAALVTVYQVHSPDVVVVSGPISLDDRPRADALVTDRPGLLLGIVTADCAPVLFADHEAGVVGAAHAGWRGAAGGVIAGTVSAMQDLGARPERIAAAVGPCIAQASYEVGEDMRAAFAAEDRGFFVPARAGHYQFDLEGYVAALCERAGVGAVDRLGRDTYADPEHFYSYRRATHRAEANYGRQLSLIGLR